MVDERNVPEGYKVTDVGVIPDDWELVPIGDIFKFKNGLNKAKQFFVEGTPIINYMDIYKSRGIRFKDIRGKVTLSSNELANYNVQKGDVFFTRTSETPDEIGITSVLLDEPQNTTFSGFILRARPVVDVLDIDYKKYCFSADIVRKEIISKCTYTTRALTNGRVLSKVNIFVPPKPEQKSIAEALSDTDNLILSLEKLIDKKKKIKQGAMQQLLTGKKRLPGFDGEWEVFKLGEVVQIFNGGTPSTSNSRYWDGSIKWCTPTDITSNKSKYLSETANKITELGLNNSSAKILPIGALLFCSRATIGEVKIANCEVATNQGFKSIVTSAGVNNEWLYYWLVQNKVTFIEKAIGSTFLEISKKDMKNIEIALPSTEEQKAIAQVLSDMDAEIEALEEKLEKVKTIKQGMMQELLTGRIRLI